ncbi:Na(+)/H(+) antiporter subunit B [Candidatus Mcinerneyibacteriota bacterium]|nr:Na(+)/H(+) antiporter subunit B [Candidatus Mcinerneyibacteriota bacterium]
MKKVIALLLFLGLLFFLGTGLEQGLKLGDRNTLAGKAGEAYLKRTVNSADPSASPSQVEYGSETDIEENAANTLTAVVVGYRSFDTLGEVTVLFLAATGVMALFFASGKKKRLALAKPNFILSVSSGFLLPLIILFGAYVFTHGHLTPGGGFQGGTIIAAAVLLLYMAGNAYKAPATGLKVLEGFSGAGYLLIGLAGLLLTGFFLNNFLPSGKMGALFSAGVIPVVYILIGLKVSAELSGIVSDYMGED